MVELESNTTLCHICNHEAEYTCENCGEYVCDNCTTPYTLHNQVDWTQCINCGENQTQAASDAYFDELKKEKEWAELETIRKNKQNEYARKRYNSAEQVEKRKLVKIKQAEERLKNRCELLNILTKNL